MLVEDRPQRQGAGLPDLLLGRQPLDCLLERNLVLEFLHSTLSSCNCVLPPPLFDLLLIIVGDANPLLLQFILFTFGRKGCASLLLGVEGRNVFTRRDGRCDISPWLGRRIEGKDTFGRVAFGRAVSNWDISRTTCHMRCDIHASSGINRGRYVGGAEESRRANGLERVLVGKFVLHWGRYGSMWK